MYLEKLDFEFSPEKLVKSLHEVIEICDFHSTNHQLGLKFRKGQFENRFYDATGGLSLKDATGKVIPQKDAPGKRLFSEEDFTEFVPEFENTYLKEVYDKIAEFHKITRVRIIKLPPKRCFSWHYDIEERIIVPITTNEACFFITQDQQALHLPADGSTWKIKANAYHTVLNAGHVDRIHMILNIYPK